jgi:hypothetical protein
MLVIISEDTSVNRLVAPRYHTFALTDLQTSGRQAPFVDRRSVVEFSGYT